MKRSSRTILAAAILAGAYGCTDYRAPSQPTEIEATSQAASYRDWNGRRHRWSSANSGSGPNAGRSSAQLVQCEKHPAFEGSGDIGPSGGEIVAGRNRLIIPPGALTSTVHITATVPEGETVFVSFQPSGLQFSKPAGLILDAEGCDISTWYAPDVVYLNDAGEVVEIIEAVYSNHWKVVAAPIEHFSGYALAW